MIPPPGMRGRSAHVKIFDGSAEARPARHRPQKEKLLERKLALEDVAFAQSVVAFDVERRKHLLVQDDVFYVGRVFGNRIDDVVAERLFFGVPVKPRLQLVGRVLHEAGHHMLSGRGDRRIGQRRNHHVDIRTPRKIAVLRVIVGAFHVFDTGRNRNRSAQVSAGAGHTLEVGQRIQREVHLAGRTAILVAVYIFQELLRQGAPSR